MSEKQIKRLEDILAEFNEDPAFRKAYQTQKPYHDLVRQIVNRRVELGLTQGDLAERAGTHQSRISKIESGSYDIRLSTLIGLAEALNTRVEIRLLPEPIEYQKLEQIEPAILVHLAG